MTISVKKAFISSEFIPSVSLCPLPWAFLFFKSSPKGELSYKVKKAPNTSKQEVMSAVKEKAR